MVNAHVCCEGARSRLEVACSCEVENRLSNFSYGCVDIDRSLARTHARTLASQRPGCPPERNSHGASLSLGANESSARCSPRAKEGRRRRFPDLLHTASSRGTEMIAEGILCDFESLRRRFFGCVPCFRRGLICPCRSSLFRCPDTTRSMLPVQQAARFVYFTSFMRLCLPVAWSVKLLQCSATHASPPQF